MATFRSGFQIFGKLTLRQSLGRIRSYSEDRKPGPWHPEDQWAVRTPCTTCPDPCKPQKPKASKSWLSICRDSESPLTCDIRHNNCPPPKPEEPWYAFITKKKQEKPKPPLSACRVGLERQAEIPDEEETCENLGEVRWSEDPPPSPPCPPEEPICKERQPAPVIRLSCPPPKELDLMLWCGKPGLSVMRIASQCQSDRMPYEEFRPRKCWKPPPYSLPCKSEAPAQQPFCCNVGRAPLAEYKQVEIPKPVYTRYKSVELEDENFLLCMTDARCPPDNSGPSLALEPPRIKKAKPPPEEPKPAPCPEKPVLVAASRKPVKLSCAPKFPFRPKPTKLTERRHSRNPCAQHNACNLKTIKPEEELKSSEPISKPLCNGEPSKVITSNITGEPPMYERSIPSKKPPLWMLVLSKPGSNDTPLVPNLDRFPKEPDWSGETDGLRFYDDQNEGICPKPPPDPSEKKAEPPSTPSPCPPQPKPKMAFPPEENEKFVLMPEKYNIRNKRPPEEKANKDLSQATFQQFIDAKTANIQKCSKLYPPKKESILYDFVRNCPLPPLDPSKPDPPPRKPPEPECPQPIRFYYRKYSTFSPFRKPQCAAYLNRMKSEDSREKRKARKLVPKPRECGPPVKGPTCNETKLPYCPKAKIPPLCEMKKTLPPCKKRLAPRPSYSEFSKEPSPCPRITECNAWEKKDMENQKKDPSRRKFSSWARNEGYVRDSQNTKLEPSDILSNSRPNPMVPGPRSEYLDTKDKEQLLAKNKRTFIQRKIWPEKELMMNFMNPTEDLDSYYTSESLVKKRKPQQWKKLKAIEPEEKNSESSAGNQLHERNIITLLQDHHTRNDANVKSLRVSRRESGLGVYVDSTLPRDFFGSISNWVTSFFKVLRKRQQSAPTSFIRKEPSLGKTYVETVDVERIMKLTKPFRHPMKANEHKISYYRVDPLGGSQLQNKVPLPLGRLWGIQWNKSLVLFPKLSKERARSSMWKFEALSPTVVVKPEEKDSGFGNQTNEIKLLPAPKETETLSRLPVPKVEEYSVPAVEHLGSRAVLLNRNLHESQKARAGHLPGKSGFRYYTSLVRESSKDRVRGVSTLPRHMETDIFLKKKLSKKEACFRPKAQAAKFMQSATSALAASVLLRKECLSWKVSYAKTPKKQTSNKAIRPITLPMKPCLYIDSNTKIGLKKALSSTNVVKRTPTKLLQDFNFYRSEGKKPKKKSNGNILEDDLRYSVYKYLKRKEVKDVLSKLDVRKNALSFSDTALKIRQKKRSRKEWVQISDDEWCTRGTSKTVRQLCCQRGHSRKNEKHVQSGVIELAGDLQNRPPPSSP